MKPLLYFFPQGSQTNLDQIPGGSLLSPVSTGHGYAKVDVVNGPSGPGKVVWFHPKANAELDPDCKLGYFPHQQTWREGPGYWVGVYNGKIPTPEDLGKTQQIGGYFITLDDGHKWLVPVARYLDGSSDFPKRIGWGKDGEYVEEPLPRFQSLCETAESLFQQYLHEGDTPISQEMYTAAAEALQVNYAVDKVGFGLIGVLTTSNVSLVLSSLFDFPRVYEWNESKKNQDLTSKTSDTVDGSVDNIQPQPSLSCGE